MPINGYLKSVLISVLVLISQGALAENDDLITTMDQGTVNWTQGYVSATGFGIPQTDRYGESEARKRALEAAQEQAINHILGTLLQIRVDATRTAQDMVRQYSFLEENLARIAANAQVTQQEYLSDGSVGITVQISIFGGFTQLMLPPEIIQIESIKTVEAVGGNAAAVDDAQTGSKAALPYTGLVVDARGIVVNPALAPRIVDEKGKEVYGGAFVSREYAVQHGVCRYTRSIEKAMRDPRVADHPMVVKGLRTERPGQIHILISDTDAKRLRGAVEHLSFLKQGRVMVVVD